MRVAPVLLFTLPALLAACYDPPPVPRSRPLACASAEAGPEANKCPDGFRCIVELSFCIPDQCATDDDCPAPLACSGLPDFECALPGSSKDGGTDGGIGDGPPASDVGDAPLDLPGAPPDAPAGTGDAPATGTTDTLLTPPTFDAPVTQG
jgi:hypothetical protein